ncbi:hypothetical protein Ancab_021107 [Ancistrocladus abbreviatus]
MCGEREMMENMQRSTSLMRKRRNKENCKASVARQRYFYSCGELPGCNLRAPTMMRSTRKVQSWIRNLQNEESRGGQISVIGRHYSSFFCALENPAVAAGTYPHLFSCGLTWSAGLSFASKKENAASLMPVECQNPKY